VADSELPKQRKQYLRDRIRSQIGETSLDDSLAAVSWMQRVLSVIAADLLESSLSDKDKRGELLQIAGRITKLVGLDRMYQAERALRGARDRHQEALPGPQLNDAPSSSRPIVRRRVTRGHGLQRIRAINACIRPADDVPSLFLNGRRCPTAVDSTRKWRMHKGKPSRDQKAAHFGDVLGYCVWRFFPRRGDARKLLESEGLAREHAEGFGEFVQGDPAGRAAGRVGYQGNAERSPGCRWTDSPPAGRRTSGPAWSRRGRRR
jgi:hypothetical protein